LRLLLDTNAFLWWVVDSPRLSKSAREAISSEDVLVSSATGFEIATKRVSVQVPAGSGERRDGIAADVGGEDVGEVGVERLFAESAGDGGGEESFDGALALLGLAAV